MPVEAGDDADGREAAKENLQQHAPAARVEVGVDGPLEQEQDDNDGRNSGQHEHGDVSSIRSQNLTRKVIAVTRGASVIKCW